MSSLLLNMRRSSSKQGKTKVINFNICRIVIPSSLVGTLFGVLINHTAGDVPILIMLGVILSFMAYTSVRNTWSLYVAESSKKLVSDSQALKDVSAKSSSIGSPLRRSEVVGAVALLLLVIFCGTFRFHMNRWSYMLAHPVFAQATRCLTLIVPISVCLLATAYSSYVNVGEKLMKPMEAFKYICMSVFTGCFAGLVGIGGGLIFSPFFLLMGLDPSVAVATSSTCVIFTSASTTFQYLFTGRIIMSLTLLYGISNLIASYCGTSLTLFLQDRFTERRSFISGIVAFAVLLSSGLVGAKLVSLCF